MATLEKIRSKSVILFVIIIVALLAFILGDFLTSSRSLTGPGTTAAKVAGQKIDIQQFNNRVEQQRQAMQAQGYADIDNAQLQNQVMEQMIYQALLDKEISELGITVTDTELSQAMTGETPLPQVVQIVRQYGFNTPAEFYDVAYNPGKYGIPAQYASQYQQAWVALENQVSESLLQQKLLNLFSGALTANELDARSYYDDNAHTAKIAYTKKDFSTVADDEAEISGDDMRAIYNNRKNRYALKEETRPINYIAIDIVPSEEDKQAAQKEVEDALVQLREQPGTEGVSGNLNFVVNRNAQPMQSLSPAIKNEIDSLAAENVRLISLRNNVYTIAKLINTYTDVDSVTVDMVAIAGDEAHRDSVMQLLNNGVAIDSLIAQGLIDNSMVEQRVYVPSTGALAETLSTSPVNVFVMPEVAVSPDGGNAYRVTKRNQPVTFYDVAEITYRVDPSPVTINNLRNSLKAYADTNNTAELFTANANMAGYMALPARVTPSSLSIGNLKDTRGPAKWAMNAKKGQVSPVYGDEQTGKFIIVAVNDVYDGGFIPARDNDVTRELTNLARAQKKGEKLMADYQGKANDVAGYAALMETPVDTTSVTFGQGMVKGLPYGQSLLLANAAAAQPGQLVGPFVTDNAIIVFNVVGEENSPRDFDFENDAMMFNQQMGSGILGRNIYEILIGHEKVNNNLQKFYAE